MRKDIVVLYHENCVDGFTAAWAAWRNMHDHAEYIPAQYGRQPPLELLRDKMVYIVDFSYKKDVLLEIGAVARGVMVLDHHKSALEDLAAFTVYDPKKVGQFYDCLTKLILESRPPIIARFDMAKSGAMLSWEFFNSGIVPPPMVRYTQAYDLWEHESMPHVREVDAYLRSYEFGFATWEALSHQVAIALEKSVVPIGEALLRRHMRSVKEHVKHSTSKERYHINGHLVNICNCPPAWASDAGNILAARQDQPFGATYYVLPSGELKFSLRSMDTKEDVAKIAEQYGGGGHRNAAGYVIPRMHEKENIHVSGV